MLEEVAITDFNSFTNTLLLELSTNEGQIYPIYASDIFAWLMYNNKEKKPDLKLWYISSPYFNDGYKDDVRREVLIYYQQIIQLKDINKLLDNELRKLKKDFELKNQENSLLLSKIEKLERK